MARPPAGGSRPAPRKGGPAKKPAARKPAPAKKAAPKKSAPKKSAPKKSAPKKAASGRAARGAVSSERSLERTRRAFARRQWARRWVTVRSVLVAVLVLGLTGLAVYALYFSAWLRTEGASVSGTGLLSREQVLTAADVPTGGPLIRVDIDAVQRRVEALAAVKSVDVTRQWPHEVRIAVTERTPIAVLELGSRRLALDATGVAFTAPPKAREGLPVVRVGAGADRDALAEGASVIAALSPEVARMVEYIEVRTVDEITLALRDKRQVRWGSADRSTDKARVLLALLQRDAKVYDVSVPGSPTTR